MRSSAKRELIGLLASIMKHWNVQLKSPESNEPLEIVIKLHGCLKISNANTMFPVEFTLYLFEMLKISETKI